MAEEAKKEEKKEKIEEGAVEGEVVKEEPIETEEPTGIDLLAREMGWNPDYKGLDREFVDSKTYILRSREIQDTMRSQLKAQGTQIEDLQQTVSSGLDNLRQHQEKVSKVEITKLKGEIASLKTKRRAAVKEGDVSLVDELDEQIEGRQAASQEAGTEISTPSPKTKATPPPEFAPWVERNQWYQTDIEMTDFANSIVNQNPQLAAPEVYSRLLKLVDRKMRAEFPDKFKKALENPSSKVPLVEGGGRKAAGKKTFTKNDLSDYQKSVLKDALKLKVMTEKEYIEDLVKTGELS